jgi:hypothetical protein
MLEAITVTHITLLLASTLHDSFHLAAQEYSYFMHTMLYITILTLCIVFMHTSNYQWCY